jgi:transposase
MVFLELTPLQRWELRELSRTAPAPVSLRALMVLWRAEGLSTLEIAARLDYHRDSVSQWIERYRQHGIAGLYDEPRSGRPRKLDAEARQVVERHLEGPPPEDGAPCARWTLPRLRTALLGLLPGTFCLDTLRHTVHALGFRWRRPRLWAHKADPETWEKQLLVELARHQTEQSAAASRTAGSDGVEAGEEAGEEPVHFLYADASDQRLLAVIRSMWMRKGQQVRVETPPHNGHWTLFGSLNALTGAFCWQAYQKAVTASFIAFLEYLLTVYSVGEILLVVDNASYHTSKATVAWLKAHPRVLLLYLPARRPDLNPVEPLWRALKAAVSANRSFDNLLALGQFIRAHFDALSPQQLLVQAGLRRDFSDAT